MHLTATLVRNTRHLRQSFTGTAASCKVRIEGSNLLHPLCAFGADATRLMELPEGSTFGSEAVTAQFRITSFSVRNISAS
jgi:hypothetical protein